MVKYMRTPTIVGNMFDILREGRHAVPGHQNLGFKVQIG